MTSFQISTPGLASLEIASPPRDLLVLPVAGPPRAPGTSGEAGIVTVTGLASTVLSGHRVVTYVSGGLLGYASNDEEQHVTAPLFITTEAVDADDPVECRSFGLLTEPSWVWEAGPVFLGTNGMLTQTAPISPALFIAQVGVAISSDSIFVDRLPSILLD